MGDVLEVHLFGGFSVQFGGEPMPPLPSRTGRLLFAYLALRAGQPQPRSLLADLFWSDVAETRARRRLSHVLWQFQDVLEELAPGRSFVRTVGDAVEFEATDSYWLDVEEFRERLDRVDAMPQLTADAERELRRCVDLYRGDLLAGYYEPWVITEQERLGHRYETALGRLVESCKARGNFDDALSFARRVTHQSPLREDAHREVMRLCVLVGQPSQALEQFERCRSVLAEELGTVPDAETMALYEQVAASRGTPARRRRERDLVSDRLVGRDTERAVLLDELEATLGGRGGIAFVEGEPGIGKSQLLHEVAADARWRGFRVLWGSCRELTGAVAYGPVRQALEPELQAVRVAQLRLGLDRVWLDVAARLLPQLADDASTVVPLTGAEQADRMREAIAQVVVALAGQAPTLLVVEDVHWADDETLGLLRLLASRGEWGRLLVVVSFRDRQARDAGEVWSMLRALDRDARPRRVALGALSLFETGRLVAELLGEHDVPGSLVASVQRESGGNPLFALEILRALRDQGRLRPGRSTNLDVVAVPVTTDLAALITGRLAGLDGRARVVVDVAAVLGVEFSLTTLAGACGIDSAEFTTAVSRLVQANVFEQTERGCRFTHAVTRRVVLQQTDPAKLRAVHGAVAESLAVFEPDQVEALAVHFCEAGQPRRALTYLEQAADEALQVHAFATAARHLATAVEQIDATPVNLADRIGLLSRYEEVLGILGRRVEQQRVLDRLDELTVGDTAARVDVLERRAVLLGHLDEFSAAEATASRAVDLAESLDPQRRAHTLLTLGQVVSWAGDNARAATILRAAVAGLPEGHPAAGEARFVLGTALRFVQDYPTAESELMGALQIGVGRDDRRAVVQALGALADLHAEIGQTEHAATEYDEAISLAREIGYRHREGVSLLNRGNLLQSTGQPTEAAASYADAERIFATLGNRRGIAMVQLNRGWLRHRWFTDDEGARADAEAGRRYFESIGNRGSEALCRETLAAVAARSGDVTLATEHLRTALEGARQGSEHRAEVQIRRSLAELALVCDDPAAAHDQAAQAYDLAQHLGMADLLAELASLDALALAGHDHEAAWDRALTAAAHLETALEPHRIHHRIARIADIVGRSKLAAEHTAAAHAILQQIVAGLSDREQDRLVRRDRELHAIVEAATATLPQHVEVIMAARDAPRGRPLRDAELVTVELRLDPHPTDAEARRGQMLDVLEQVRRQGAEATVASLATIFDVSRSTVHRDLARLRAAGHDATTRGTGIG